MLVFLTGIRIPVLCLLQLITGGGKWGEDKAVVVKLGCVRMQRVIERGRD